MTSLLIVAKGKEKRQEYIQTFCRQNTIEKFDITIIEKDETKQSLGIDDIKQMQKKIFLKPLRSEMKAVVIEDSHLLTVEAQNSLLKVLEEPPAHTFIILSADSEESLLPTIRSRCQIVKLDVEINYTISLSRTETQKIEAFLSELNQMTILQALKYAETMAKDKEKTITWIEKVILVAREQLLHPYSSSKVKQTQEINSEEHQATKIIKLLQKLHTLLKTTNVNPRFAIEHTLLSFIRYNVPYAKPG